MSDDTPLGFSLPKELQWTPPKPKPVSEQERAATETHLHGLRVLGAALDGDFDVDEEMHKRGLKTSAELEAEQAKAEHNAALDEADRADKAAFALDGLASSIDRTFAEAEANLQRGAEKAVKRLGKTLAKVATGKNRS